MKALALTIFILISGPLCAKEFNVAVLYWSSNIEGQVAMRDGLEQKTKHLNKTTNDKINLIPYVAGDGAHGVKNQVKQFYKILKRKRAVDLIIVQPTDNAALTAPLIKANKLGIPVVAYDQYILDGELESFITSNNYQAGSLGAEYISSLFDKNYEIKLIIVEYPKVSSTIERVDGFIDTLKKLNQRYKIIGNYEAVEPVSGNAAAKKIIADFPTKGSIDVIFTINDGGGLPIVKHLYKNKRNEIKIATVDGDPKSVKNITQNKLTVIDSAQFCAEIGRQSILAGYKVLKKQKVAKKILVPTFPITKETIGIYPGWRGQVPKKFKKPWLKSKTWNNSLVGK